MKGRVSPIPRAFERTAFLRLPRRDWAAITTGEKTEFRSPGGSGVPPLGMLKPPTPVIVYSPPSGYGGPDLLFELMVLEECFKEPLGAISAESLANEGFESLDQFRRYWKLRFTKQRRPWVPGKPISVFRLRPWKPVSDADHFARVLLERLYLDPVEAGRQ